MRLLALLACCSCRGVDMVPTMGAAWHEESQTYSGMVGVSFIPAEAPEVASTATFRGDEPVGGSEPRPRWSASEEAESPPAAAAQPHAAIEGGGWKVSQPALLAIVSLLTVLLGGGAVYRARSHDS